MFSQEYFTCEWWFNVDCSASESLYSLNEDRLSQSSSVQQPQDTRAPTNYGAPTPTSYAPTPTSYAPAGGRAPPRLVTRPRGTYNPVPCFQTRHFKKPRFPCFELQKLD